MPPPKGAIVTEAEARKAWAAYYEACAAYREARDYHDEMMAEAGSSWVFGGGHPEDAWAAARQAVGYGPVPPEAPPFPNPDAEVVLPAAPVEDDGYPF
jgi:hypothetical protein